MIPTDKNGSTLVSECEELRGDESKPAPGKSFNENASSVSTVPGSRAARALQTPQQRCLLHGSNIPSPKDDFTIAGAERTMISELLVEGEEHHSDEVADGWRWPVDSLWQISVPLRFIIGGLALVTQRAAA